MTISAAALGTWLSDNGYADGPEAQEKALDLLRLIRESTASTPGDTRNIHDFLKSLSTEEIRDDLHKTRSGLVSVFVNILGDFNLSSGVRNANWFNINRVIIAGRRKWDRRGAVGTQHYTQVDYVATAHDAIAALRTEGYRIVAAEINEDAVPLTTYQWQEKSAVIYGEEGAGLSADILAEVDDVVYIPGRGSVRSLNVSTTSGIFDYDYSMKMGLIDS